MISPDHLLYIHFNVHLQFLRIANWEQSPQKLIVITLQINATLYNFQSTLTNMYHQKITSHMLNPFPR